MKITLKRTISFLLAFAIVFAMLPAVGVYAASLQGHFDRVVSISWGCKFSTERNRQSRF